MMRFDLGLSVSIHESSEEDIPSELILCPEEKTTNNALRIAPYLTYIVAPVNFVMHSFYIALDKSIGRIISM